jgi:uncharacterized protein (TIGR01777 family)
MKIVVSGSSGLIGSAVVDRLQKTCNVDALCRDAASHADQSATQTLVAPEPLEIIRLVRRTPRAGCGEVFWDPASRRLDATALEGCDAVIHLAGDNIADEHWTTDKKVRIRASRIEGTSLLCRALAQLARPPRVLVSASAIGYYGDCGDALLDESSPPGAGFLPTVCQAWESATQPAVDAGIRVVLSRFGMVLSPKGGVLARMLPMFRWGLGGTLGSGQQWVSWITIDDAAAAIVFLLHAEGLAGPVNAVSPGAVSNHRFAATLASTLRRPAWLPAPAFALRLAFGEMADALLLASTRVIPRKLFDAGFSFADPILGPALERILRIGYHHE